MSRRTACTLSFWHFINTLRLITLYSASLEAIGFYWKNLDLRQIIDGQTMIAWRSALCMSALKRCIRKREENDRRFRQQMPFWCIWSYIRVILIRRKSSHLRSNQSLQRCGMRFCFRQREILLRLRQSHRRHQRKICLIICCLQEQSI